MGVSGWWVLVVGGCGGGCWGVEVGVGVLGGVEVWV